MAATATAPPPTRSYAWVAGVVAAGALVALTVGIVAKTQQSDSPGGYFQLFFTDPIHLKAWFATAAALLGCVQLFTAAWIFRRLPLPRTRWVNVVHRWSGRTAFVCTLPVAYHCVFKLGFHTDRGDRVAFHSLLGCAFYGAYVAKVSIVRLHRFPGWVLPVMGGTLFTILIAAWYSSALWFFRLVGEGL